MQIYGKFFAINKQPGKNTAGLLLYMANGLWSYLQLNIASMNVDQVN